MFACPPPAFNTWLSRTSRYLYCRPATCSGVQVEYEIYHLIQSNDIPFFRKRRNKITECITSSGSISSWPSVCHLIGITPICSILSCTMFLFRQVLSHIRNQCICPNFFKNKLEKNVGNNQNNATSYFF
jgi:hypothetical protein